MGEVFRARRTRLGDVVALKVLHVDDRERDLHRQFMREAQISAMLRHPHIVSVLDFGIASTVGPYLVMEHLNGPSLREQLTHRGSLPLEEVRRIAVQLASALNLAHSQGVVHRDLKPGNVMTHRYMSGEIVYKVIDFGIGALLRTDSKRWSPDRRVLVTPAYASPEQLTGLPVDARSDIYSLGVMIYELLAGRRPFVESETGSLITKHLSATPAPPTMFRREIPPSMEAAVLKALAKEPQSRWETATEFAQALSGAAPHRPPVVPISVSRLGDEYELGRFVGRGRLGSRIYEGTHRATGHAVAIRVIRREKEASWEAARSRFMREARMTPVNHPSVLRVRDYGEEAHLVYVVTDPAPGSSLREVLDRDGPLDWSRGHSLLLDLVSATRALHAHGFLVFGVTPSIIRLSTTGDRERLVVSSAGIADIGEVIAQRPALSPKVIEPDAFYLAPELLTGDKPDGRSDLFTIGVIGYEMFTGQRPFAARTLRQLFATELSGQIVDPRRYAASVPEAAARCILRCLARRPDERFADIIELESIWTACSEHRAEGISAERL